MGEEVRLGDEEEERQRGDKGVVGAGVKIAGVEGRVVEREEIPRHPRLLRVAGVAKRRRRRRQRRRLRRTPIDSRVVLNEPPLDAVEDAVNAAVAR